MKQQNIFCLGIYRSVSKPSTRLWKRVISTKWRDKLLIQNINLAVHRKSEYCLRLLVSWRHESMLRFGIGDPRLFRRVSATMLSNYIKYELKMSSILLNFITYLSCERASKNGRVKMKIFRKLSLNFTFGQGRCFISEFARPISDKAVLLQRLGAWNQKLTPVFMVYF